MEFLSEENPMSFRTAEKAIWPRTAINQGFSADLRRLDWISSAWRGIMLNGLSQE